MNGHTWQTAPQNFYYLWHHYFILEALSERHKPINVKKNCVLRAALCASSAKQQTLIFLFNLTKYIQSQGSQT